MRSTICSLLGLVLSAGLIPLPSTAWGQGACRFFTHATGDLVVPPNESDGEGFLDSRFDNPCVGDNKTGSNPLDQSTWFIVSYHTLEGAVTGARIRRGIPGSNGPEVLTLFEGYFPSDSTVTIVVPDEVCVEASLGFTYFVVETDAYPEGEVRGQIALECWSPIVPASWGRVRTIYR